MIRLRQTTLNDLSFVCQAEAHPDNCNFVYQWEQHEHDEALNNPNFAHYIILHNNEPSGYVILDEVLNSSDSINLRRLVVTQKGLGIGRQTLELIKDITFNKFNAHRLWLDVFCDNLTAYQLYKKVGFREEGLLRESYLRNGIHVSQYIMAILKQEYMNN